MAMLDQLMEFAPGAPATAARKHEIFELPHNYITKKRLWRVEVHMEKRSLRRQADEKAFSVRGYDPAYMAPHRTNHPPWRAERLEGHPEDILQGPQGPEAAPAGHRVQRVCACGVRMKAAGADMCARCAVRQFLAAPCLMAS